ncbi:unannotated protein [freshwater metagenome]|uniref:Unannotated protein n=1 Tax=freshwater metagenome TaxID=449393 RepID=A0A6J7MQZ5_9ZZZZ
MLEVAAAAIPWPCPLAGRFHAIRGRLDDLDRVSTNDLARYVGDRDSYPLAGQRVTHEDGVAGQVGDEVTAVGNGADVDHGLFSDVNRSLHRPLPRLGMPTSASVACIG